MDVIATEPNSKNREGPDVTKEIDLLRGMVAMLIEMLPRHTRECRVHRTHPSYGNEYCDCKMQEMRDKSRKLLGGQCDQCEAWVPKRHEVQTNPLDDDPSLFLCPQCFEKLQQTIAEQEQEKLVCSTCGKKGSEDKTISARYTPWWRHHLALGGGCASKPETAVMCEKCDDTAMEAFHEEEAKDDE